jgi:hypothetical protein
VDEGDGSVELVVFDDLQNTWSPEPAGVETERTSLHFPHTRPLSTIFSQELTAPHGPQRFNRLWSADMEMVRGQRRVPNLSRRVDDATALHAIDMFGPRLRINDP